MPAAYTYSAPARAARGAPAFLTPEEEEGYLRRAGRATASGVSRLGNLLDVPGSMARDFATWLPDGPAPANPFDQLLTPTTPENRTTGRDLLRGYDMIGRRDNLGNFFGGMGAEIALDPLTYLSFGGSALTKLGRGARAAGTLDDATRTAATKAGVAFGDIGAREARVMEGMGGVAGIGLPFMDPALVLGTGKGGQWIARKLDKYSPYPFDPGSWMRNEKGVTSGSDWLDSVTKPVRAGVGLTHRTLDRAIGEAGTTMGRFMGRSAFRGEEDVLAQARGSISPLVKGLDEIGWMDDPQRAMELRYLSETPAPLRPQGLDPAVEEYLGFHDPAMQRMPAEGQANATWLRDLDDPAVNPYGIRQTGKGVFAVVDKSTGLVHTGALAEVDAMQLAAAKNQAERVAQYSPRHIEADYDPARAKNFERAHSVFDPSQIQRKSYLKGYGGFLGDEYLAPTQVMHRIAADPVVENLITGKAKRSDIARYIDDTYGPVIRDPNLNERVENLLKRNPAATAQDIADLTAKSRAAHIRQFTGFIKKRTPEQRAKGIFTSNPVLDTQSRLVSHGTSMVNAKEVLEGLAQPGVLRRFKQADDDVELGHILSDTAFDVGAARTLLAGKKRLKPTALREAYVDKAHADDFRRLIRKYSSPEPIKEAAGFFDSFLNLTKGAFTTPWPAFTIRNLFSGQVDNILEGMWSPGSVHAAHNMLRGGVARVAKDIPEVQQIAAQRGIALTDEAATDILGDLAYAHGVVGRHSGEYAAVAGAASPQHGVDDMLLELVGPGRKHFGLRKTAGKYIGMGGTTLNPVKAQWRGVGSATESTLGPMAAGQHIGHYVEGLNRLSPFIELLRKGVSPQEAARRVGKTQVQYNSRYFTKTEDQILKRLIPFYSFSSRKLPWAAKHLSERPGGALAQVVRGMNTARDPNAMTPDYVAEQASIPTEGTPLESLLGPPKEPGADRYLTGFGLSIEDPLSFLGGGNLVRGPLQEMGSRLNPLVKGPLEYALGTSFFQKGPLGGRELQDMDPTLARTAANISELMGGERQRRVRPLGSQVYGDNLFEQIVANSPLSRLTTTVRTLTDPRKSAAAKAVNLGTGFRVTDVSPAAQEAIARESVSSLMQDEGASAFSVVRFTKDDIERVMRTDPEKARQWLAANAILDRFARSAKERKAATNN